MVCAIINLIKNQLVTIFGCCFLKMRMKLAIHNITNDDQIIVASHNRGLLVYYLDRKS